jgi:hypothetical protein
VASGRPLPGERGEGRLLTDIAVERVVALIRELEEYPERAADNELLTDHRRPSHRAPMW